MAKRESERPLIGITADVEELPPAKDGSQRLRYRVAAAYAQRVAECGGTPVILPPIVEAIEATLNRLDGVLLTGGGDIIMEPLGGKTHPAAEVVHRARQEYELALFGALTKRPEMPVLAICLGMQYMTIHAGGELCQHLPDVLKSAEIHRNQVHEVIPCRVKWGSRKPRWAERLERGNSASNHHQGMLSAGSLAVVAKASDGTIEAVADVARRYYLGVQWHPERTVERGLGIDLIRSFVDECRVAGGV
ncbi:MAG: gamma-glutamyl-gamma-aminobutyrate hydrolase family protein [Planctomycetes bacterium]|nr:gamma-glutamyl-gamma-aminobutyrate hydrolase family protein [Planctomycetota bacterium]